MQAKIKYINLGLINYHQCWDYQQQLMNEIIENKETKKSDIDGYILLCEHPHVFTLGKSGQESNLLVNNEFLQSVNAQFIKTNRGGDITYHGPGQLVGYPILDLEKLNIYIKKYVFLLEESIIKTLADYNIESNRMNGATGVWINQKNKICALGIRASRMVTMHGFALNINTNLDYFKYINPCGFIDKGVTSLQNEYKKNIPIEELKHTFLKNFTSVFNIQLTT